MLMRARSRSASVEGEGAGPARRDRLTGVTFDAASIGHGTPEQEGERLTAIRDLLDDNVFGLVGRDGGPYWLHLTIQEGKLSLQVRDEADRGMVTHLLSLSPFRGIIKDYMMVCDSHHAARRSASSAGIEAIDMGRRGLHDEAGHLLAERLRSRIAVDFPTARRLFTLIVALHWKG